MTDPDSSLPTTSDALPPIVRAEAHASIIPRKSWVWTIAFAYSGVFIAFPLLDRIGTLMAAGSEARGAPPATFFWACATALLGVLLCDVLLYNPTGTWGWSSGRRLTLTSASAFGASGAEWITGLGVAAGAMAAFAVALHMAVRLVLLGLILCGLMDGDVLEPCRIGTIELESPVFLLTAAFWIFITGTAGLLGLPSVVFSLMQVYTPVAFLLLAATALLTSGGLPMYFQISEISGTVAASGRQGGVAGSAGLLELLLGAFAFSGLFAVEWGMSVQRRLDVRIGGWVGVLLAGSIAVVLALLTVAGTMGMGSSVPSGLSTGVDLLTVPFSLHWAILRGIGGRTGGAILMLFGLASLAPACYAIAVYSNRLHDHWPRMSLSWWTWIGSIPPFLLVATSLAARLETIFGLMGIVFGPMVAVISTEAVRSRFRWEGIREGWNLPGLLSWACGLSAGFLARGRLEPATLFAYGVAAGTYGLSCLIFPARPIVHLSPARSPEERG